MQVLQSWTARTQLPMSNVARAQQGLGAEQLRVNSKNEHVPTHDFHIGQSVMYLNPVNRRWYPAIRYPGEILLEGVGLAHWRCEEYI